MDKPFPRLGVGAVAFLLLSSSLLPACRRPAPPRSSRTAFFEPGVSPDGFFPRTFKPEAAGISRAALEALVAEAAACHSHALIVIKDGRTVAERYFDHPRRPLRLNSVTKSIVSLAIGMLVKEGRIAGIDTPLSEWFPQWEKGAKARITLRNVLTHTSGLYHEQSGSNLRRQRDVVKYALGLPIVDEPGRKFTYSNEAIALLPGIVSAAAGRPLDAFLQDRLFGPMGISSYDWDRDQAGHVLAYSGLRMLPRDLARIGQLMLDSGRWKERQLIPASWVRASTSPARDDITRCGLLWWLYRSPGSQARTALASQESSRGSPAGPPVGFGGEGWLGQYVTVYPRWRLVAVRLRTRESEDDNDRQYDFKSFPQLVLALVTDKQPGPSGSRIDVP